MEKDTQLVNIYLKIHHKQPLILDDLRYLAEYAPECFEKTCKNVVYNIPEAKPIMEASVPEPQKQEVKQEEAIRQNRNIEKILENIKRLEINDFPVVNLDVNKVKTLLGNLFMELLFPHNNKDSFMSVTNDRTTSTFDQKA